MFTPYHAVARYDHATRLPHTKFQSQHAQDHPVRQLRCTGRYVKWKGVWWMLILAAESSRSALPCRGEESVGASEPIVATQRGGHWFFLFGYEKNERAAITNAERDVLQLYASEFLKMSTAQLNRAVQYGDLQEISHDEDP